MTASALESVRVPHAQVQLPEGVAVVTVLTEVDPDVMTFKFRPVKEA